MSRDAQAGCPACGGGGPLRPVEDWLDPVAGARYRLASCPACGVVSSEPRVPVGADWYEKAAPLRGREGRAPAAADWRFGSFLGDFRADGPGGAPAGRRLLDVGCGDGGFLALAKGAGFVPTGFDYDERVVARARAAGLDAAAAEFSAFCAGRRPGEFDAVTLFDVLEHTPEPAWFLGELERLMAPGAWVALTMPDASRPLPFGREEHDYPPHHFTRWSPAAMRGFLERRGYEVVRQASSPLRARWLADHAFFHRLMPPALAAFRRLRFGERASVPGATVSSLYGAEGCGALADKARRQALVDAARIVFEVSFLPVSLPMRFYYTARGMGGDTLYTLARRKGR